MFDASAQANISWNASAVFLGYKLDPRCLIKHRHGFFKAVDVIELRSAPDSIADVGVNRRLVEELIRVLATAATPAGAEAPTGPIDARSHLLERRMRLACQQWRSLALLIGCRGSAGLIASFSPGSGRPRRRSGVSLKRPAFRYALAAVREPCLLRQAGKLGITGSQECDPTEVSQAKALDDRC